MPESTTQHTAQMPLEFLPTTADESHGTVDAVVMSERPIRIMDGGELLPEIVDLDGVHLYGDRDSVPLIDSHRYKETSAILGAVTNFRRDGERMLATLKFDMEDERAAALFSKAKRGFVTDVSVTYIPKDDGVEYLPANKRRDWRGRSFAGPMNFVTAADIVEVSIVPVGRNPEARMQSLDTPLERHSDMKEKTTKTAPAPADVTENTNNESERARVAQITELARFCSIDETLMDRAIVEGWPAETAKRQFALSMQRSPATPPPVYIEHDAAPKRNLGIVAALARSAGLPLDKEDDEAARQFPGLTIGETARICLENAGKRAPSNRTDCINLALESSRGRSLRLQGNEDLSARSLVLNHGTDDLPLLLGALVNKALQVGYQRARTTYQFWTRRVSIPDFKERNSLRLSDIGEPRQVLEKGRIREVTLSESGEKYSLATYASIVSVTRQALYNDDLSALTTVPARLAASARRLTNRHVYATLNNGHDTVLMSDDEPLFDAAAHDNYATTGTALAIGTLDAAVAAMRKQTDLEGGVLNIEPRFLLVPPELWGTAQQLTASLAAPGQENSGVINPFVNRLTVVDDAELSASATAWYLASDSLEADHIEVAFLNGRDEPLLESDQAPFDQLGMKWRVVHDFAVKAVDWRGLQKRSGASG